MFLYFALDGQLESDALGQTLGALCLAEGLAMVMVAGFGEAEKLPKMGWLEGLENLLVRWVSACVVFLGALIADLLPLFQGNPVLLICALGLALCLSVLRLVSSCRWSFTGRKTVWPVVRWAILGLLVFWISELAKAEALPTIGLAVLVVLVMTMIQMRGIRAMLSLHPAALADNSPENLLALAAKIVPVLDILILPFLLPPSAAAAYLGARAVAMVIELGVLLLCRRSRRGIVQAAGAGGQAAFRIMAARLNLGMLFIGGGLGLGVLSGAPYLARIMDGPMLEFRGLLIWLILAQMSPAIFGAADLLLDVARHRRDTFLVRLGGIICFSAAAAFARPDTAMLLAQQVAILHLALGGALACVLAWRTGIWPGLTALCFRQIRLF